MEFVEIVPVRNYVKTPIRDKVKVSFFKNPKGVTFLKFVIGHDVVTKLGLRDKDFVTVSINPSSNSIFLIKKSPNPSMGRVLANPRRSLKKGCQFIK